MIDHLRLKMVIQMTMAQKHKYRTTGYNNPWDATTSITAYYFMQLDRFQVSLGNHGIATSEEEKMMAAGAQMWKSKIFTEDQMVAWENKTAAQQTWAALQTYFTDKWLEWKQYSGTKAKQSCFKEAALLAQETAAAEEEEESQAMLFAMLQEQHNKQIAAMTATNKANMDVMMDWMNALVAERGGDRRTPTQQPDKRNIPPGGNIRPPMDMDQNKKPRKQTSLCPHCKNICPPQTRQMLRTRGKQRQALARLEVRPCHHLTIPGTETVDVELAANLVTTKLNSNYWSPLACLVKEQEEPIAEYHTSIDRPMSAIMAGSPPNKVAVHWA
jgi:hypothetical protein